MPDDILEYWMSLARELAHRFNIAEFDKSSELWSWDNFAEEIKTLQTKCSPDGRHINIMGLQLDLETGETVDTLTGKKVNTSRILPFLYYYSRAQDVGVANEWVKFNTLRGSWACRYSFDEEDLKALTNAFIEKREKLFEAFERLGAKRVDLGDAAFEIEFLPNIKVLLIFEDEDEEFPASVRLLYDKNSIHYLPHELLGDISWFLASRALKAIQ